MNKKGSIMGVLFSLLVFIILWSMFFASWLSEWGNRFIDDQSLSGLSAFLVANMNIWVFGGLMIGAVATIYLGGRT